MIHLVKWFEKIFRFFQGNINNSIYKEGEVQVFQLLNDIRKKIYSVVLVSFLKRFFQYSSWGTVYIIHAAYFFVMYAKFHNIFLLYTFIEFIITHHCKLVISLLCFKSITQQFLFNGTLIFSQKANPFHTLISENITKKKFYWWET